MLLANVFRKSRDEKSAEGTSVGKECPKLKGLYRKLCTYLYNVVYTDAKNDDKRKQLIDMCGEASGALYIIYAR